MLRTLVFPLVLILSMPLHAAPASQELSSQEREALRMKLERSFNEVDLLLKNEKADKSDLNRIEKDMKGLKVYERIPFKENLPQLKKDLTESAKEKGLGFVGLQITGRDRALKKSEMPPQSVFTDQSDFRITPQQIASEIRFRVRVSGSYEKVKQWLLSWPEEQMRLAEPVGGFGNFPIVAQQNFNVWAVNAVAFRYREIDFPRLKPRDPMEYLPAWAKKNPKLFAKQEPRLWELVKGIQTRMPKVKDQLETRRKFMLRQARMDFFLSKAAPKPKMDDEDDDAP